MHQPLRKALIRTWQLIAYGPPPAIGFAGEGALIFRPRRIEGARHIRIGTRTRVLQHGWLSAVESYGEQQFAPQLVIGDNVQIGRYSCITCACSVVIEDGCLLSEHVYISDHSHGVDPRHGPPLQQPLVSKGPVRIGTCSFLGYRVCVLPGVTLGRHCVVGANSVVTRSFPDYSMLAGSPARMIKRFSLAEGQWVAVNG